LLSVACCSFVLMFAGVAVRVAVQHFLVQQCLLPSFGTSSLEVSRESHLQVLLDKPLLDANHPAVTDIQGLGNQPISVTGCFLTLITHQQHTRYEIVPGRSPAGLHHRLQKRIVCAHSTCA